MSKVAKRKHVQRENNLPEFFDPPSENQSIVRILSSCGNNLHKVEDANGEQYTVSMITKFRRNIWVKRGDFVIVDPIPEGVAVKAEIVRVLSKEHMKYFKKINVWPAAFIANVETTSWHQHQNNSGRSSSNSDFEIDGVRRDNDTFDTSSTESTESSSSPSSDSDNQISATDNKPDNNEPSSGDISLDKIAFSPEQCVPSWR